VYIDDASDAVENSKDEKGTASLWRRISSLAEEGEAAMSLAVAEATKSDAAANLFKAAGSTTDTGDHNTGDTKLEEEILEAADSAFAQQMQQDEDLAGETGEVEAGEFEDAEQCRTCGTPCHFSYV
jgi:hypothetical protein